MATRQCTEQVKELQEALESMGIPIEKPSWMLGDNQSAITLSTIPSSTLKKQHQALRYHYVQSCVAHKWIKFCYLKSEQNIADMYTKFLPFYSFWHLVQPLLFWKGETLSG